MNNFDSWNQLKQKIHKKKNKVHYCKVKEIWWANIGYNIGSEIYGKGKDFIRPCLIIKKSSLQGSLVIPLTSKIKKADQYYKFTCKNKIQQCACIHQIRYIDNRRLIKKISRIKSCSFRKLIEQAKNNYFKI